MSQELLQYGSHLNPQEIAEVLDRIFQRNLEIGRSGRSAVHALDAGSRGPMATGP